MLLTLPLVFLAAQAVNAFPNILPKLWSRAVTAQAYVTNNDGTYNLSSYTAPTQGSGGTAPSGSMPLTLQVNDKTTKQSIVGFGAAVTDATTSVISNLSATMQKQIWTTLMTPNSGTGSGLGANFSLIRHTIGASDLSPVVYTYDDNNNQTDLNLSNFTLGTSGTLMAQTLQTMRTYNPAMTILGTPWTPPAWMKNNRDLYGNGNATLNSNYYNQYAQYFVKYLNAFTKYVPIYAITIQNEPNNVQAGLPSMKVTANDAVNLIQNYVGPAVQSASSVPQIWALDHNTDDLDYANTVISGAPNYAKAVAWHCYTSDTAGWGPLTTFHNNHSGVDQYMTECSTVNGAGGHWYGASNFTINPLQNWAKGVISFTLATDTNDGPTVGSAACPDCQGLVVVNTTAGTYYLTTKFWTMAQYSRFMPRGALVMDVTGGVSNSAGMVLSVATMNPDGTTKTVVVQNTFAQDLYLTVSFASGALSYTGTVLKNSVTTWVLPK